MHASTPDAPAHLGPAIVIPGAPLLVPELVGVPGDPEADRLRAAVLAAGRWLGARAGTWRVASSTPVTWPDGAGTFLGYGADVRVALGPGDAAEPDPDWPLPLLIAAWLRGASAPSARIAGPGRGGIGPVGTVFVLDGPNTLTERAPGGHHPEDAAIFDAQVTAVTAGEVAGAPGPAWAAAAEAFAGGPVDVLYRGAPFGVGYLVATGGRA